MPNHVMNSVTIEGTPEQISAVEDLLIVRDREQPVTDFMGKETGETELFTGVDFNILVPMPEALKNQGNLSYEDMKKGPNWYEWSIQNWSTKWNAYSFKQNDAGDFVFDTAWATPDMIWRTLAERLPEGVTVRVEWSDDGGPQGAYVIRKHEVTEEARPDVEWSDED